MAYAVCSDLTFVTTERDQCHPQEAICKVISPTQLEAEIIKMRRNRRKMAPCIAIQVITDHYFGNNGDTDLGELNGRNTHTHTPNPVSI